MTSQIARQLLEIFTTAENVWHFTAEDLHALGFENSRIEKMKAFRDQYDFEQEFLKMERQNIKIVSLHDEAYPVLLKNCTDPPIVLFYKGNLLEQEHTLAMVGARAASVYGKNVALKLAEELGLHHIGIVSGGARGIDSCAHQGALKGKAYTIAVVANGLDICYPPENQRLFYQILDMGGAIISEYPLSSPPKPYHFPARNRIINGLAEGVIVIEAALKSGSLITADCALEEGRDVFAVPGSILSKTSAGTNRLIKQGAIPITSVDDIFEEKNWYIEEAKTTLVQLTLEESALLEYIPYDSGVHLEYLYMKSHMPINQLSKTLMLLVLKEFVREESNHTYTRIK